MEAWAIIVSFLQDIPDILSAIIITLATSSLLWIFRARVKIIYGTTNWSLHRLPSRDGNPPGVVSSEKIYIQNTGKKGASEIELVFSHEPFSYKLFPPRDHTSNTLPDGEYSVSIHALAPGDLLIVDVLSTGTRVELFSVNCPDCIPCVVPFLPQRQFGKWVYALVAYLMISGFVGTVYGVLQFL